MLTEGLCCDQAQVILITGCSIIFAFLMGALVYYKYKGNCSNSNTTRNSYRRLNEQ